MNRSGLVEALKPRESGPVPALRKYPNELHGRAQRLVAEAREQAPDLTLNAAVKRIGPRVGVNPGTLRGWCKQADVDAGARSGRRRLTRPRSRRSSGRTVSSSGLTTCPLAKLRGPIRCRYMFGSSIDGSRSFG